MRGGRLLNTQVFNPRSGLFTQQVFPEPQWRVGDPRQGVPGLERQAGLFRMWEKRLPRLWTFV